MTRFSSLWAYSIIQLWTYRFLFLMKRCHFTLIDISKSHEPELGDRAVSYAARTPTNVLVGEGLFVGLSAANDEFLFSMVQRGSFSGSGVSNGKFVGINVGRNILTETDDGSLILQNPASSTGRLRA